MMQFLVEVRENNRKKVFIWDTKKGLQLGHVAPWMVDFSSGLISFVHVSNTAYSVQEEAYFEFDPSELKRWKRLSGQLEVRLKAVRKGQGQKGYQDLIQTNSAMIIPVQFRESVEHVEQSRQFSKRLGGVVAAASILLGILGQFKTEPTPVQVAEVSPSSFDAPFESSEALGNAKDDSASGGKKISKSIATLISRSASLSAGLLEKTAHADLLSSVEFSHSDSFGSAEALKAKGHSVRMLSHGNTGGGGGSGFSVGVSSGGGGNFLGMKGASSKKSYGLSQDEVGRVIHKHISEIRYCYESVILKDPTLGGKLVVDFVIQSKGRVKKTSVKETNLKNSALNNCILRKLAGWKFPKPKGGVEVAVSYPFIFKTIER